MDCHRAVASAVDAVSPGTFFTVPQLLANCATVLCARDRRSTHSGADGKGDATTCTSTSHSAVQQTVLPGNPHR